MKRVFQAPPQIDIPKDHAPFNYKDVEVLKRYLTEYGSIVPRTRTNLSAKEHRRLAQEIKRARHLGMLPFLTTL